MYVKAKKALGQHFLKDLSIARRIVDELTIPESKVTGEPDAITNVIEVGPGTGVLTQYLVNDKRINLILAEIDNESVNYLRVHYPNLGSSLIEGDFLKMDLTRLFEGDFMIIGNFPYNISSQIFFKVLEYRESVPQVVGMLQKEVAERLASPPGNKSYGILSVLLQAWYHIEYLFTVDENSFIPPPKVKSAVIRIKRNTRTSLGCDEVLFKSVIKTTFNQRRKTIRNSIKPIAGGAELPDDILFTKRPEQLSVEQFVELTNLLEKSLKKGSGSKGL
jgi:16S rRNA (adenine1518-N6/adenine1519-N6)-dimethyltransferase